jgi:hypothetical protein
MTAKSTVAFLTLLVVVGLVAAQAQTAKYPPVEQYLMFQADEIALGKNCGFGEYLGPCNHQSSHEIWI